MPGLSSVAHKKTAGYTLSTHTPDEIERLVAEAKDAQTEVHLAENPRVSREALTRAIEVASEIEARSSSCSTTAKRTLTIRSLRRSAGPCPRRTLAGLAQALDDYAALAKPHRKDLDGLGDFDVALLNDAPGLAARIRARSVATAPSPAHTAAMEKRNRVVNTLAVRVVAARSAARFVFRKHPEIARRATSAYQRRTRAASRRAAAAATTRATKT